VTESLTIPIVARRLLVTPAKEFVKEALTACSLVTPAQAGVHSSNRTTQRSSGQALQLLETPRAAEPWVPAFAGKTISLRQVVRDLEFIFGRILSESWPSQIALPTGRGYISSLERVCGGRA